MSVAPIDNDFPASSQELNSDSRSIRFSRVQKLLGQIFALTKPYLDQMGRMIQIWSVPEAKPIATVLSPNGSLNLVSPMKIKNPMSPSDSSETIHNRLLGAHPDTNWNLLLRPDGTIVIWPKLSAAGWKDAIPQRDEKATGFRRLAASRTREQMCEWFYTNGYHLDFYDRKTQVEICMRGSEHPIRYQADDYESICNALQEGGHILYVHCERPSQVEKGNKLAKRSLSFRHPKDKTESIFNVDCSKVYKDSLWHFEKEAKYHIEARGENPLEEFEINMKEVYRTNSLEKTVKHVVRTNLVVEPFFRHYSNLEISKEAFKESLQYNRLTNLYNINHPSNPIPDRGSSNRKMERIYSRVGQIKGMFESVESLFEDEHVFVVPAVDGNMPFTNDELKQILRELAIGIFVHDTVPFFSLHFNGDGNMYPVIHPVYENTLIGRFMGMLDYYMKGFLNGAFFDEKVLYEWEPNKKGFWSVEDISNEILQSRISDLHEYCAKNISEEFLYFSVKDLLNRKKFDLREEGKFQDHPIFNDYSDFSSSFKIISKQNSIKKDGNIFTLDSDFDVLYTIEPDADYEDARTRYKQLHSSEPEGYEFLDSVYREMAKEIKEQMPKLPICKKLFAMLGVINFFSYYFKTLKENDKVPLFEPFQVKNDYRLPAVFPGLPISSKEIERVTLNVARDILPTHPYSNNDRIGKKVGIPFQGIGSELDRIESSLSTNLRYHFSSTKKTKESFVNLVKQHVEKSFILKVSSPRIRRIISQENYQWPENVVEETARKIVDKMEGILPLEKRKEICWKRSKFDYYVGDSIYYNKTLTVSLERIFANMEVTAVLQGNIVDTVERWCDIEKYERKKIMGGCGIDLSEKTISSNPDLCTILNEHFSIVSSSDVETWQAIKTEDEQPAKAFTFKIAINDFIASSNEDYGFFYDCLISRERWHFKYTPRLIALMYSGDGSEFQNILNETKCRRISFTKKDEVYLLNHAATISDIHFLRHLLKFGCSANQKDEFGNTPYHFAAAYGHINHLKLLDESCKGYLWGKTADLKLIKNKSGATPLHIAARHNQVKVIHFLVKEYRKDYEKDPISFRSPFGERAINEMTPLQLALYHGYEESALAILDIPLDNLYFHYNQGVHTASLAKQIKSPLFYAAELGMTSVVESLIQRNMYGGFPENDSSTALHIASKNGHLAICEVLLDEDLLKNGFIKVDTAMNSGKMPIHFAIEEGHFSIVELLVRKGALIKSLVKSVKERWFGPCGWERSYPRFKWEKNYLSTFKYMPTDSHETILLIAIRFENTMITLFLIEEIKKLPEVDKNRFLNFKDEFGESPLLLAAMNGNWDVIDSLLDAGVVVDSYSDLFNVLCKRADDLYLMAFLRKYPEENYDFNKSIQIAAQHGNSKALMFLERQEGVNVDFVDDSGKTLLHYAAQNDRDTMICEYLESADPQTALFPAGHAKSLAYLAAENGSRRSLKILLEYMQQHSIALERHFGDKHLLYAPIFAQQLQCIDMILPYVLNPNIPLSEKHEYAPHIAVERGNIRLLNFLIVRGFNFDCEDTRQWTPLHYAVYLDRRKELVFFIKEGINREVFRDCIKLAILEERTKTLEIFSNEGFQVDPKDPEFSQVLLLVKERNEAAESEEFSQTLELIKKGDERVLERDLSLKGNQRVSAFLSLACSNHTELLEKVLEKDPSLVHLKDKEGKTGLVHAILMRQLENIKVLLEYGADINLEDYYRRTPLLCGITCGNSTIVRYLLSKKADVNQRILVSHRTHLHIALEMGLVEISLILIANNANLNCSDHKGVYPIHIAAENGNLAVLRILSEHGHSLEVGDYSGKTPAHYAAVSKKENRKALKFFKEKNIFLDKPAQYENSYILEHVERESDFLGLTPLHMASLKGNVDNVKELALLGANSENRSCVSKDHLSVAVSSGCREILEFFQEKRFLEKDEEMRYALFTAAKFDYADLLAILFQNGIPIDEPLVDGLTALHCSSFSGAAKSAKYLLDHEASVYALNSQDVTPLEYSAVFGSPSHLKLFLSQENVYVDKVNYDGETLLHLAVGTGRILNVALLIYWGCDLNICDANGNTPLHIAAIQGNFEVIKMLLLCGGDSQIKNLAGKCPGDLIPQVDTKSLEVFQAYERAIMERKEGDTPLHVAVRQNFHSVFPLLVKIVDINAKNAKGDTPLHLSLKRKNYKMMRRFINEGADLNICNCKGKTPLYIAMFQHMNKGLSKFLLSSGARLEIVSFLEHHKREILFQYTRENKDKETLDSDLKEIEISLKKYIDNFIMMYEEHNEAGMSREDLKKRANNYIIDHFDYLVSFMGEISRHIRSCGDSRT